MPGMKIFGRTLMLIGGLQNYRHGTIYCLLYTAVVFPLELGTEVGWSSISTCITASAGRNISAVGQKRLPS